MDIDKNKIIELSLNDVLPNRFQPRIKFREDSIIELADSIKAHGVIQPIIVRPLGDKYEIVAGERRYKACLLAGVSSIPSRVIDYNDKDSAEIALIENVQRRNLNPIEEAISYSKILDMGYLTQEQLATKLGMSQSTIANKKRLLNLCDEVQEALMEEKISERHARSLLKIKESSEQRNMLKRIIKERLTVRRLDEEIKLFLNNKSENKIEEKEIILDNQVKEELDEQEYLDISNMIDESELQTFIESISNPLEIDKEEIKEIDEEMNNLHDFSQRTNNTIENNGKFFTNTLSNESIDTTNVNQNSMSAIKKMNDLMAPEGSNISFGENNLNDSNSIFSAITQSQNMNNINEQKNGGSVNSETMFSNLMNPTVDNENSNYIDGDTFSKFLDPSYVDGAKKQELVQDKSTIDSSVFSKFLNKDSGIQNFENKIENQIDNATQPPISTNIFQMPNLESSDKRDVNSFNEINQVQSNLLQNNEILNSSNQTQSDLFENNEISNQANNKPDFLAPMNFNNSNDFVNTNISNNLLTPDSSITNSINNPIENNYKQEEPAFISNLTNVNQEEPIFLRASSSDYDKNEIPVNPIIENSNMSKLLSLNDENNEFKPTNTEVFNESHGVGNLETSDDLVNTNANLNSNNSSEISSQIDNRPIIITDYNKQYDPVLPTTLSEVAPQIDLRQIINMIRELSDKIENYGYTIDTEEIDLSDSYQVIFNIEKK